jgi:hypothetical protein
MPNIQYKCDICDYHCGNKKFNYIKHIQSKKHLKRVNGDNTSITSDITETTDYHSDHDDDDEHIPESVPRPHSHTLHTNIDFQLNMILQEINLLKSQNLLYQNDISSLKTQMTILETKILILNNNEIQSIKTVQQIQSITQSQNIQQIQTVAVSNTKNVSKKQTVNQPTDTTTESKETPVTKQTLTEYLNTACENAVDFDVFRKANKDIDINKYVNESHIKELPDAENTLSNYVMAYLKHFPLEKIPFRCIDVQNQKVVIKVKGKWYLASNEDRYSFIDYAKDRLNSNVSKSLTNYSDECEQKLEKFNKGIKQYEQIEFQLKQTPDERDRVIVKSGFFENFDYRGTIRSVEMMLDEQCTIINKVTKFPEVKKSFINTLLHEVLKYCKIDVRNLEVDELPMYYPEVIQTITPEPEQPKIMFAIKEATPEEHISPSYACSKKLFETYARKISVVGFLANNALNMLVKIHILKSFGYQNATLTDKYFETQMTKQQIITFMDRFNTTTSISDIILDKNMEYKNKLNSITEKIEELLKENILNEESPEEE